MRPPSARRLGRLSATAVKVCLCVLASVAFLTALSACAESGAEVPTTSQSAPASLADQKLDQEIAKLEQEVEQLKIQNSRNDGWFGYALAVAPFITAMVAILTLAVAVWKQRSDASRQRSEDRVLRQREIEQRFDEQFSSAVSDLGSEEARVQAAGASSLLRLQGGATPQLQREVVLYCIAQFRVGGVAERVRPIMLDVFRSALSAVLAQDSPASIAGFNLNQAALAGVDWSGLHFGRVPVNLTDADLTGANLRGSDLWGVSARHCTLAKADCGKANFGPAVLAEADLSGARLDGAKLGSAKLRGASLAGASLLGASLQSAHFQKANLTSADFRHADVNDAYFSGAQYNDATLKSLRAAKNVDKAHFDQTMLDDLTAASTMPAALVLEAQT